MIYTNYNAKTKVEINYYQLGLYEYAGPGLPCGEMGISGRRLGENKIGKFSAVTQADYGFNGVEIRE